MIRKVPSPENRAKNSQDILIQMLSDGEWHRYSELADLKKMSKTKRLQAMEALWDSLIYENGEIDAPIGMKRYLKREKIRFQMVKQNLSLFQNLRRVANNENRRCLYLGRSC